MFRHRINQQISDHKNWPFFPIIVILIIIGCSNNEKQCENLTCNSDSLFTSDTLINEMTTLYSSSINGKTAIGNIRFGISNSEFKEERKKFLNDYPTIADMDIEDIKGIFNNNMLISLIIHSSGKLMSKPDIISRNDFNKHFYSSSKLVKLYDKKYSQYKENVDYYLKDGISYKIILKHYKVPELITKEVTNQNDDKEEFISWSNFSSKNIGFYKAYDYIIISNQLYVDSLKIESEKIIKNAEKQKEKKDYNAI